MTNAKNRIKLLADSCSDLFGLEEKCGCDILPLVVTLGEEEFYDNGKDTTPEKIYETYEKSKILPKTSAVNVAAYEEVFDKYSKEYDAVIYFALSSGISSSYNNAVVAAKKYNNIHVIDSKSLSVGIAVQVFKAYDMIQSGMELNEILENVNKNVAKTHSSFVIDSLEFLHKGGRCSTLQFLGANIFRIKPSLILNEEGRIVTWKKFKGNQKVVIGDYANTVLNNYPNPDKTRCFIAHTRMPQEWIDSTVEKCKQAGFKEVIVATAGCTVTSHCGEHTLGILFINE